MRRLRGTTVGDEITGNLITYDGTRETFNATSSAANTGSASTPPSSTRVRAVLMPREGTEAAAEAARSAEPAPAPNGPVGNPASGGRR